MTRCIFISINVEGSAKRGLPLDLVANAVLTAHGYAPMSYRKVDGEKYRGALLLFYEQDTIANFRDLYLEQLEEAVNYDFLF